jgi:hypothetical protein
MYEATGVLVLLLIAVGGGAEVWERILTGNGTLGGGGARPVADGAEGGGSESGEQDCEASCSDRCRALVVSRWNG